METEKQEQFPQLETAVDQAIAACGGDVRAAVRALIIANSYLAHELERPGNRSRPDIRRGCERGDTQPRRTMRR
jgi:hypothetical protein